jgi:hypothetical protein
MSALVGAEVYCIDAYTLLYVELFSFFYTGMSLGGAVVSMGNTEASLVDTQVSLLRTYILL